MIGSHETLHQAPSTQQPETPPRNLDHQALNETWRTYFAQQDTDPAPSINTDNLLPSANVPWGPDAHMHRDEDIFRVVFGNQNGFSQVNNSLPSWASTMDFLQGLNTSLFAFTEPNSQWDKTILQEAKQLQRRFFAHGHLIASESKSHFPTSYEPGGTCIGVNGKCRSGVDPSGQGRWSYMTISGKDAPDIVFTSAH
jgi:hypothetical protein